MFVSVLLAVAFLTVAERKTLGYMQRRVGPNAVGYYGVLMAIADAAKLLLKEIIIPTHADKLILAILLAGTMNLSKYVYLQEAI